MGIRSYISSSVFAVAAMLPVSALAGQWTVGQVKTDISLPYKVYIPEIHEESMPLVVMLHGCLAVPDKAKQFDYDTGFSKVADANGIAVLFPEEPDGPGGRNFMGCWNWFESVNQKRFSSETGAVVEMIKQISTQYQIDSNRIYVAGFSAGAAMTHIMTSCYPDIFKAGAIHSGLSYKAADNMGSAWMAMSQGPAYSVAAMAKAAYQCAAEVPDRKPVPLMVIHGSKDTTVSPNNSKKIIEVENAMVDLLDDGVANQSSSLVPAEIQTLPPAAAGAYSTQIQTYTAPQSVLTMVTVDGLGHKWSGGPANGRYADPKGANVSQMIWDFFQSVNAAH